MRRWGLGVLVVAGACSVGGCSLLPPQSVSDTKTLDQSVTSIKLDGRSGGVEVRGQAGLSKVTVDRTIKYTSGQPKTDTYRVDDGVLVLTGECGDNCDVEYLVTVPAGLAVSGQTSTGHIELHNVGPVDVTATTGSIDLVDVVGPVKAHTSNGSIEGTGLRGGAVQANTSNGSIELTLATAADVQARSTNGAIKLAVPSDSYRVQTDTHNGHRKIGVTDDPSGKHTLDLNTDNGSIEVTQV
jgi:hypothetical protein